MFITFEGGEGTGKTTAMKSLGERLERQGLEVLLTKEPGGCELGKGIRKLLLDAGDEPPCPQAELLLFLADRAQHVEAVVRPALKAGKIVLCDRYEDSTIAYQGYGRRLFVPQTLRAMSADASGWLKPDMTILLDMPPKAAVARARTRNEEGAKETRFDDEDMTFHEAVRQGYLEMAEKEPDRFVVIDASRNAAAVSDACFEAVAVRIEKLLENSESCRILPQTDAVPR